MVLNKQIIIILSILSITSISCIYAVSTQFNQVTSLSISTPTGTANILPSETVKIFTDNGGNYKFLAPRVTYVSQVTRLQWDSTIQNNFVNDQMNDISQYPDVLRHAQPLNGTFFSVSITPIINTIDKPITLKLLDNSVFTGNIITIQPTNYAPITQIINYNFNEGDNLIWKITGRTTNANSFIFNAQVIIDYNK